MSTFPKWLAVLLVVAILCIVAGGAWFYRMQQDYVRQDIEPDLETIAQLKVGQIVAWREDQLGEAEELSSSSFLAAGVEQWFANPASSPEYILQRFRSLQHHYGYLDVIMVDTNGHVRLSLAGIHHEVHTGAREDLATALREGRPVLTDLHTGEVAAAPHVSAIAPLFVGAGSERRAIGAVILVNDASKFLYPLVQSWPTPSESSETLLIRRDGDSALFLNNLKYKPDAALKLRIPLTQTNVPAVMAIGGRTGVVYGLDYRGVPVVSVVRPIPGSPWFMVSKMDAAEAFAGWRFRSVLILALLLGLLLLLGAMVGMVWLKKSGEYYRELYKAEAERHETEERYRATLMSVGDAVIATDAGGRVEILNAVAEKLTGWQQDEAIGRPLEEVFHIINEDTRAKVENPVSQVVREGIVVGLANHTLLVSRDGTERAIADSGAPIHGADGKLVGVVLVFRDQTEMREAERSVREAEEHFRSFFDNAPMGKSITAPDGRLIRVNPAFCAMLGYSAEEMQRMSFADITYPEDLPETRECVRSLLAGKQDTWRMEKRYVARDGRAIWTHVTTTLRSDERGAPLYFLTHIIDITDRKQAESERRGLLEQSDRDRRALLGILEDQRRAEVMLRAAAEKRRELEVIINRSPAVAFLWKAEEGWPVEYVSENVKQFGISAEDLTTGRISFASLIHPDDLARVADEVAMHSRDGGSDEYTQEYRLLLPDSRIIWLYDRTWIRRGEQGKITHYQGIVVDITERKKAEVALRESEQRFRSLVNTIPDLVWLKNPDGVYLACNHRFTEFFGAEEEKILGRTDYDFVDRKVADSFREHDRKAMEAGGPSVNEEWVTFASDGHRELLETIKTPLSDTEGRVIGVLGVGRDITDRKKVEEEIHRLNEELEQRVRERTAELEAANKELESFSYSVSHDLRAPLRSIDGFSQAVLEESEKQLSEGTLGNLRRVRAAAQQMSRLIDGMLGLARLTRREMRRREVDMGPIAAELVRTLRKTDTGRQVEVEIGQNLVVHGDPDMLKIVVQNLIENAWKFTGKTEKARIEFGVMEQGSDGVMGHPNTPELQNSKTQVFFVRDNGAGFDPTYAGKLFGAFQRLHAESEFSGTGLGLASVQRILLRHGGKIWAEGAVGKGATFYFTV
ncbi:MAG TPA: PAS domain S-box protein [Kiritimatiellia bacterium]|nr:PAS domain S-box protein [Kiritimatiellia bacterium]